MSQHLLLIPFHFPPIQGSTGAFRSLGFSRWLPENGWRVTVLTASERAYPDISLTNYELVDRQSSVHRGFALDAKKHLSFGGRYLRLTALPDRWASWILGGVISGLKIVRRDPPNAIYTTYPIPSSHVIGLILHKLTGIPWIAEFRDPMVEEGYPANASERNIRIRIEKAVIANAARVITVTPSARQLYQQRAQKGDEFVINIENGYDDLLTSSESGAADNRAEHRTESLEILHSGILYDDVRNPSRLFEALQELKAEGFFDNKRIKFVFRGSGRDSEYLRIAHDLGIESVVEFRQPIAYAEAHQELHRADALLLMQGIQCNRQIPAKFYEYCALRKPILSLADPAGDTGSLFERCGLGESVPLESPNLIKNRIQSFFREYCENDAKIVPSRILESMSRRARSRELADVLRQITGHAPAQEADK